jgi:hypothetical protein
VKKPDFSTASCRRPEPPREHHRWSLVVPKHGDSHGEVSVCEGCGVLRVTFDDWTDPDGRSSFYYEAL